MQLAINLPRISFSTVGDAAVFCGAASVAAAGAGNEKFVKNSF